MSSFQAHFTFTFQSHLDELNIYFAAENYATPAAF